MSVENTSIWRKCSHINLYYLFHFSLLSLQPILSPKPPQTNVYNTRSIEPAVAIFFSLVHLATLQNAAVSLGTDFYNRSFLLGWMKMLGFRSFASNCLALAQRPWDTNQSMWVLPGSLMFWSNLLGMVKSAQEPCRILGDIGQSCPWKACDSVPGWTAFQSLGMLPGIFQFSDRNTASATIGVAYILTSQMPELKKLFLSANLELCASCICCQ